MQTPKIASPAQKQTSARPLEHLLRPVYVAREAVNTQCALAMRDTSIRQEVASVAITGYN